MSSAVAVHTKGLGFLVVGGEVVLDLGDEVGHGVGHSAA